MPVVRRATQRWKDRVDGYSGNADALGRQLAPEGLILSPPPKLPGFVEFGEAAFRSGAPEGGNTAARGGVSPLARLSSDGVQAQPDRVDRGLRLAGPSQDRRPRGAEAGEAGTRSALIREAAELLSALVRRLHGDGAAAVVTSVPCGHSRRSDCFGKRIAQAMAKDLGLPFVQVFADRPCSGVSHPKEFAKLPPLEQIADPLSSMLLVDDLATSGWHVEESLTALRRLGASAPAFVWIAGTVA